MRTLFLSLAVGLLAVCLAACEKKVEQGSLSGGTPGVALPMGAAPAVEK